MKFASFEVGGVASYGAVVGDGAIDFGRRLVRSVKIWRSTILSFPSRS